MCITHQDYSDVHTHQEYSDVHTCCCWNLKFHSFFLHTSQGRWCLDGNRPLRYTTPHHLLYLSLLYQIAKMKRQGNGKNCCLVFPGPCTVTFMYSDMSTLALCGQNIYKGNQVHSHNLTIYPETFISKCSMSMDLMNLE